MLRVIVVALGAASLMGALAIWLAAPAAWPASLDLGILGALILVGTLFERHYRSRPAQLDPAWEATDERFIDPASGKLVQVRYNAQTGERAYDDVD